MEPKVTTQTPHVANLNKDGQALNQEEYWIEPVEQENFDIFNIEGNQKNDKNENDNKESEKPESQNDSEDSFSKRFEN